MDHNDCYVCTTSSRCRSCPMASMNNPGAGPLSGVPLRGEFRHILHWPSRMSDPFRGTPLVERTGSSEFDAGSGQVDINIVLAMVKHTPMRKGETSGVCKGDRPVSFIFVPPAGYKWQVMSKVSTVRVRCKI